MLYLNKGKIKVKTTSLTTSLVCVSHVDVILYHNFTCHTFRLKHYTA